MPVVVLVSCSAISKAIRSIIELARRVQAQIPGVIDTARFSPNPFPCAPSLVRRGGNALGARRKCVQHDQTVDLDFGWF